MLLNHCVTMRGPHIFTFSLEANRPFGRYRGLLIDEAKPIPSHTQFVHLPD